MDAENSINLGGIAEVSSFCPRNGAEAFFDRQLIYGEKRRSEMAVPEYSKVKHLEKKYSRIPICKEIYADVITPITLLRRLSQIDEQYFLLESVEGGNQWGRYSFLGAKPLLTLRCKNHVVTVEQNGFQETAAGDGLAVLRQYLKQYQAPVLEGMPGFTGGFVGYFSYEMIGYLEPKLKLPESEFNDYELMLFDKVIVYDHLKQKICIIVNYAAKDKLQGYQKAEAEIEALIHWICEPTLPAKQKPVKAPEFSCNLSKEQYCAMVEQTKNHIREGDIFQGVISRRFEAEYHGNLINSYRVLRTSNPSPYMYFIQSRELQIAGSSPETMVKLEQGLLTTFPVAGTRHRGATKEEDLALEQELLSDEKECAEHNMLVDLARNDIGKIAEYGSVKVEESMQIHRFSKVMHIASVVTGQLRKGLDGCDTISALLPAGTLSGAPKFRACEIIRDLEPVPRGIYGGAIGYLDLSGNLDVCIAIRTAVKKGTHLYIQAGAGIVADSVPELEYEECANKAGAVMEAVRRAEEVDLL